MTISLHALAKMACVEREYFCMLVVKGNVKEESEVKNYHFEGSCMLFELWP